MQEYKRIDISKDQVVPVAERMRKQNVYLVMIHAFVNKEGLLDVSWDYAVDPAIESYHVVGETVLPSVGELFGIEFEGLDMSQRLFLPEDLLETQGRGQIMVTPLSELVEKNRKEAEK